MNYPDFNLSAETETLLAEAREFVRDVLEPAEAAVDAIADPAEAYASSEYTTAVAEGYKRGYHKMTIPKHLGGLGYNRFDYFLVASEMALGAPAISSEFLNSSTAAALISGYRLYENNSVYREYLQAYVDDVEGRHSSAWGATEPTLGSDIFNSSESFGRLNTVARRTRDGYRITGEKTQFVGNGYRADYILLMAAIEDENGAFEGHGALLFSLDRDGVSRGNPLDKIGLRAGNQGAVFFDGVEVDSSALIVPPDRYAKFFRSFVTVGNTVVGFAALGIARGSYESGLAYAKERVQGGKRLIEHQLIAAKLFDSYTRIESSRSLLWRAGGLIEAKRPDTALSFAARVSATRACLDVTQDMAQVLGGYGITKASGRIERHVRDARMMTIADGTLERVTLSAAEML